MSCIYVDVSCAGGNIWRENLPFWEQARSWTMNTVGVATFSVGECMYVSLYRA
jgi:hypothetical protein